MPSMTIAAPSLKIEAPKISMPSMSLSIAAPNIAIGGNLGINASAGIGGASVSIAAPKITIPSMNVKIAAPSVSVKTSANVALVCEAGHPIRKYEAGASRGRNSDDRVCDHCQVSFKESQKASYNCDHACDYDSCEECYAKRSAVRAETSASVRCTACILF